MRAAEAYVELHHPRDDLGGESRYKQYMSALNSPNMPERMRESIEVELAELDVPEDCLGIWEIFVDIFTGEPISYTEILAYSTLYNYSFSPDELDDLRMMDGAGCVVANKIRFPKDK